MAVMLFIGPGRSSGSLIAGKVELTLHSWLETSAPYPKGCREPTCLR
jgi:hypothetical protein